MTLSTFASWALRLLPPELAHSVASPGIRTQLIRPRLSLPSGLETNLGQLALSHPLGLAAGFDKDGSLYGGLQHLGFSFIEVGTVTPKAQNGNPKPRLFRYPGERSLINRMGFNNPGIEGVRRNLLRHGVRKVPLGINLCKNKTTPNARAIEDYLAGFRGFHDLGDYFVINVSSPNTPELRKLANPQFITALSSAIDAQFPGLKAKTWLKLSPDMDKKFFQQVVAVAGEQAFAGLILTNTHGVEFPEVGGLSGAPIREAANQALDWACEVHQGQLPVVGCGGIMSAQDVQEKLDRGAVAVQVYTAFVYQGWGVVPHLLQNLTLLDRCAS